MSKWQLITVVLACLSISSCAKKVDKNRLESINSSQLEKQMNSDETLYGFSIVEGKISTQVVSLGCTQSTDFKIVVHATEPTLALELVRLKPDLCRAMPHLVELSMTVPNIRSIKVDKSHFINDIKQLNDFKGVIRN